MSEVSSSLSDLQHRLLEAVTQPNVDPLPVETEILPSQQQSAAERLGVYQHAYVARLLDVLRELFPCTRFAVDDDLFDQFAAGYLRRYPPHSYTLGRLADRWVSYLDETRPVEWGSFIVELSRLEQAIDRIFDGLGPEALPPFALPANPDDGLRLTFVPSFELHAFQYPVSAYFTAWKATQSPAWPDRREQFIALLRRDYIVRRHELSREQFDLLTALSQGRSLGDALYQVPTAKPADVHAWFSAWSASGLFATAVIVEN